MKHTKDPSANFSLDGQKSSITSLDWNPQTPTILCTASDDAHVYLWNIDKYTESKNDNDDNSKNNNNIKSCKPYHIIKTGNPLNGISWSHDGRKICISDRENTITLVDGYKYTELKKYKAPSTTKIHSFIWTNDDKYILITTKDGYIKIFDSNNLGNPLHEFQIHCGNCFCIDITSNSEYIATGGADSMIAVIDMNNLIQKYGLIPFETSVNCVSFNYNNKLIASSSDDSFIDISYIDNKSVNQVHRINTKSSVHSLKWHPTKHMLAYAGHPVIGSNGNSNSNNNNNSNNNSNNDNDDSNDGSVNDVNSEHLTQIGNNYSSTNVNIWGALKKY